MRRTSNLTHRLHYFPSGVSFEMQQRAIRSGVHILVATPGRALDHISRGTIDLSNVKHVVLDEVSDFTPQATGLEQLFSIVPYCTYASSYNLLTCSSFLASSPYIAGRYYVGDGFPKRCGNHYHECKGTRRRGKNESYRLSVC